MFVISTLLSIYEINFLVFFELSTLWIQIKLMNTDYWPAKTIFQVDLSLDRNAVCVVFFYVIKFSEENIQNHNAKRSTALMPILYLSTRLFVIISRQSTDGHMLQKMKSLSDWKMLHIFYPLIRCQEFSHSFGDSVILN